MIVEVFHVEINWAMYFRYDKDGNIEVKYGNSEWMLNKGYKSFEHIANYFSQYKEFEITLRRNG